MAAFKMLTDKLFIGEETSKSCLRIIPLVMSIINHYIQKIKSGVSGEDTLHLFFCTGLVEAIATSYSPEAASIVASFRVDHLQLWELVAQLVVGSSPRVRDRAIRAVEFWGLVKGAISSLFAKMFSSNPIPSLRLAAYTVLSTKPISRLAIFADGNAPLSDESLSGQDSSNDSLQCEDKLRLRDE